MDFEKLSYEELKEINEATSKEIVKRENKRKFELLLNIKIAITAWQEEFPDSNIFIHERFDKDNVVCLSDIDLQRLTSLMEKL